MTRSETYILQNFLIRREYGNLRFKNKNANSSIDFEILVDNKAIALNYEDICDYNDNHILGNLLIQDCKEYNSKKPER